MRRIAKAKPQVITAEQFATMLGEFLFNKRIGFKTEDQARNFAVDLFVGDLISFEYSIFIYIDR